MKSCHICANRPHRLGFDFLSLHSTFEGDLLSILSSSRVCVPSLPRDASQLTEVIIHYPHVILANRTEGFLRSYGNAAPSWNQTGWKNDEVM